MIKVSGHILEISGHTPEICTNLEISKHTLEISGHTQETLSNLGGGGFTFCPEIFRSLKACYPEKKCLYLSLTPWTLHLSPSQFLKN